YQAATDQLGENEEFVAHEWLAEVFEPTVRAVPRHLRGKLEPAEFFHELLEHRWFMAQNAGHDIAMPQAVDSYIENVLRHRPDEEAILGLDTATLHVLDVGVHRHRERAAAPTGRGGHPRAGHRHAARHRRGLNPRCF